MVKAANLYNINHERFINPIEPEICYLLGLLWADGYIGRNHWDYLIVLELNETDFLSIDNLMNYIGKWYKVYIKSKNKIFGKKSYECQAKIKASTSNKQLYNFLLSMDYNTKSTSSPNKILNIIPKPLQRYWFLGYFDGDGCWYIGNRYYFKSSSTYEQDWEFLHNYLSHNNIPISIPYKELKSNGTKGSHYYITKLSSIVQLGNLIYPNGFEFGLKRKYDKYKQIEERYLSKINSSASSVCQT